MDNLYEDADLYDLVSPRDAEMERFYVQEAGGADLSVLELACGTGRLTAPIVASGARVVATDLSETMLEVALARANAARFLRLDMREFVLGERFDRIVVAANSLGHLTESAALLHGLRAIARHLKPGGRLVFDIFSPNPAMLSMPPDQRLPVGVFEHAALGRVSVEETIRYDALTQVSHIDWHWSRTGEPEFRRTTLAMRQVFPEELVATLDAAGLWLSERYGDFERGAFTAQSYRQVCVCRAR